MCWSPTVQVDSGGWLLILCKSSWSKFQGGILKPKVIHSFLFSLLFPVTQAGPCPLPPSIQYLKIISIQAVLMWQMGILCQLPSGETFIRSCVPSEGNILENWEVEGVEGEALLF